MFLVTNPDRNWGCRLDDRIIWQGYRAIVLQNELLQIVILVDKGAEIIQFLYKPLDVDFLWRSPNGLRRAEHFATADGTKASPFFDRWGGGWFEVLPNGGPATSVAGAPLGTYAETTDVRWQYRILQDDPEEVRVGFWIKTYRTPFLLQKTLTLKSGSPALFIEEKLTNLGQEAVHFMWGHHPVVGEPFLDEYCRISAPESIVQVLHAEDGPDHRMGLHQEAPWPVIEDRDGAPLDLRIVPPKTRQAMDNCYLKDFANGWISVHHTQKKIGFGMAWDANVFPYIWLWQAFGGGIGYPWYGRSYCLGIEPWASYPCAGLKTAIENQTARQLAPGTSLDTWLTAVAIRGGDDVSYISRNGTIEW
jgi:galactose mutarotase-like enzyme